MMFMLIKVELTKVSKLIYTLCTNPNLNCNPYGEAIQQCLSM